ncbi:MAG: DNA polymerase I [Candidatus Omnitrophota bacterium]
MGDKELYLVDATAFCYRAFYALKGLSTSFGQQTNAIYGFVNMLNKVIKKAKPEYLAVCFDVSRDTFRQKKYAEYKINRPPMPDGLVGQIPFIKEIVSAHGLKILEKEGFEADDIIATAAEKFGSRDLKVTIVSSDKDILQLVGKHTFVFSPYKDEGTLYDRNKVIERFGVEPEKISDVLSLMGDDVDNIPGIAGIGEKTAVSLVSEFGSLANILANAEKIKQEKIRNTILNNIGQIKLNKELAELDRNVEIEAGLEDLRIKSPNKEELFRIFKHLEFKSFIKDLALTQERSDAPREDEIEENEFSKLIGQGDELFLSGDSLTGMSFVVKGNFLRLKSASEKTKKILSDEKIKKISHGLKKIKVSLAKEDVHLNGLYFDTLIAAYLIMPSLPDYSLSELAWHFLKVPQGQVRNNQEALSLIIRLKEKLENELQEKSLLGLFRDLEMPLASVLADMELTGVKIDTLGLKTLSSEIEKRLIKLIEEIYSLCGCQFNINSPKQLREVLFEKLKLPVVKRTKSGPSTDEEVLRSLADKHELPALLLEYRQLMKLKTTYVDTLPELADKKTSRIHTSFNQAGTETGRLSSSNPNLQNIPVKTEIGRHIRKAVIALSESSSLLSSDYSQVELRILAHLSKDGNLISAFKEGKDIHRITASLIYGLDEKDVASGMREVAKRVNFGIIYGLTSFGLSKDLKISVEEAQNFIDAYFMRYPGVKEYIQAEILKAKEQGFVTTLLGRRRYLPEINNKNQSLRSFAERQAVNTPIQGSAADLIKLAMVDIHKLLEEKKLKARMLLQVHDELLFDVPQDELSVVTHLVRSRMENILQLDVPIKADIKIGNNWLEMEEVK